MHNQYIQYHINIDQTCKPVIHPPRRVPVTLRPKIQDELKRKEKLNVIEKVEAPTEWINSMVTIIKPNGQLRICIDPRDLNKTDGMKPDPKKTQAITDMAALTNKEDLQRFLGMLTYLAKFIPNLSQVSAPLRSLLEQGNE